MTQEAKPLSAEDIKNLREVASLGGHVGVGGKWLSQVLDHIDAQAAEIARLREALEDADARCDALCDLAYVNGAKHGWNCADTDNEKMFAELQRNRTGPALKMLAELYAKRAALQEPKT